MFQRQTRSYHNHYLDNHFYMKWYRRASLKVCGWFQSRLRQTRENYNDWYKDWFILTSIEKNASITSIALSEPLSPVM
jgi:hypothetical protein